MGGFPGRPAAPWARFAQGFGYVTGNALKRHLSIVRCERDYRVDIPVQTLSDMLDLTVFRVTARKSPARLRVLTDDVMQWSSPGLMDTFSPMKESVFHAENEEPVPYGIQGTDGRAGANWAQC